MGDIIGWDFTDRALNSTTQQINRQKSAMNLEILRFNKIKQKALFLDPRNGEISASLIECECKDFNFSGKSKRKKFAPCMHVYRLAIELDIIPAKYYDRKTILASMTPEERKAEEARRISQIPPDPNMWGSWAEGVHSARCQKNRQYRAYEIFSKNDRSWYQTTLDHCSCPDFEAREIPCKHIYWLALTEGHKLLVTFDDYKKSQEEYEED